MATSATHRGQCSAVGGFVRSGWPERRQDGIQEAVAVADQLVASERSVGVLDDRTAFGLPEDLGEARRRNRPRGQQVPKNSAVIDARELVIVPDEQELRGGTQTRQEPGEDLEGAHRRLFNDQCVCLHRRGTR